MTENDFIAELQKHWPQVGDDPMAAMALADEALCAFPRLARLWCLRGKLIALGSEDCPVQSEEALECYIKAIDIDPYCAEAWEQAGFFQDGALHNEAAAQRFLREAKRLRGLGDAGKERRIAGALLTLLASGGTMDRAVAELPMFKVQIESAFAWMKRNAQCTNAEIERRAVQLRGVILRKREACENKAFDLAAELRAEECALAESLGLKAKGTCWDSRMDVACQMQNLSALLHEMQQMESVKEPSN